MEIILTNFLASWTRPREPRGGRAATCLNVTRVVAIRFREGARSLARSALLKLERLCI